MALLLRTAAFSTFLVCVLAASGASAHCCHDERSLEAEARDSLRRGLHSGAGRLGDDEDEEYYEETPPPSIGPGLGRGAAGGPVSDFGQLRGNSIGNYRGGTIGQPGPSGWIGGDPPQAR